MKHITLALAAVVSLGFLSACDRREPEAPAAEPAGVADEAAPAPMEPAPVEPAPGTDPVPAPVSADGTPVEVAPADGTKVDDTEEDQDSPHSGGDKVGTKPSPASGG